MRGRLGIQIPKDVEPYFIGIWRFRVVGEEKMWCATYCFNGCYYDTEGSKTIAGALNKVRRGLRIAKKITVDYGKKGFDRNGEL